MRALFALLLRATNRANIKFVDLSIGDEEPGQVAAYEANYRVGVPVVHEILVQLATLRERCCLRLRGFTR